jgi:enterochelin esterase-like enzyme
MSHNYQSHIRRLGRGVAVSAGPAALLIVFTLMPAAPAQSLSRALACAQQTGTLVETEIQSAVYESLVPVHVYLPPCYQLKSRRLPVLYLLHGAGADEPQWPDLGVPEEADALIAAGAPPFVVVMPDGGYYVTVDHAAFVLDELIPQIERRYPVAADRSRRAIGGLSLGGYWALRIALGHPGWFVAAGGHSPMLDTGQHNDLLALADAADGLRPLRIMLDIGDQDSLQYGTAQLAQVLADRSVFVNYAMHAGGHNRAYWRSHTGEYLRFYVNVIGRPPAEALPRHR